MKNRIQKLEHKSTKEYVLIFVSYCYDGFYLMCGGVKSSRAHKTYSGAKNGSL